MPENEIDYSKEEIKAEFDRLFNNACEIRLRSDVPLASALSGGLDSSSIYAKVNRMEMIQLDSAQAIIVHVSICVLKTLWTASMNLLSQSHYISNSHAIFLHRVRKVYGAICR